MVALTWLDPHHLDDRDVDGAVAVIEAARVVDAPHSLPTTVSSLRGWLAHGWDGDPRKVAVHRDGTGRVVGVLEVWLPEWDNTHLGSVAVTVDPAARRRRIGGRLFEAGTDAIRSSGRNLVLAGCFTDTAGVEFLRARQLTPASTEVERRLDLVDVDRRRLADEYAAAERRAAGYELVRMPESVPDELLDDVVALTAAINDAPTDDLQVEDEVFSPARIRGFEAAHRARGCRLYRLAARHRAGGALVGHTVVAVEREQPWWGWQYDTAVLAEHRGHRLGLLLKIAMLGWLGEREAQLRTLDTWNAASNTHMVRVNEVLGYRVVAHMVEWQRRL